MPPAGDKFFLHGGGTSRTFPRLVIPVEKLHNASLPAVVAEAARNQLGIELSYLGPVALDPSAEHCGIVVAASANGNTHQQGDLALTALPDLLDPTGTNPGRAHLESALRWREADAAADSLASSIRKAFDTSIAYLDAHVCTENGHKGWNQYQNGSPPGIISTAQALLSHVYAGRREELVEEASRTLESLQNPDGGWQVRRALVGAPSQASITESTSYCLWALCEAGRSATSPAVHRGLDWLEAMQNPDGGWHPAQPGQTPHVVATAMAMRALAGFKRMSKVDRAVGWLRSAQNADGGWGPTANTRNAGPGSSAAYTAHALLALRQAGVDPGDRTVQRARGFLEASFDPALEEPWPSALFTIQVDPVTFSLMDFRHFATPWALAALSSAGRDLSDATVLLGTLRLLRLQQATGAWRCGLTDPEAFPVWACHDALYALRSVMAASAERLEPIILAPYTHAEKGLLEEAMAKLATLSARVGTAARDRRSYGTTVWLSLLTVFVALLALFQLGIVEALSESSGLRRVGAWALTAVVAAIGAVGPLIAVEEYKIRRQIRR
ncbi:hypothetical protein CUT44_29445 [Streptomyces carminius]|uniref:Prenyltransferase alpha-alpha toroid domain-containing protein n=1 Tax=Streptomyces carminius TaxID=2665496 RepID=A0A2M8LQY9_9ACTN|nr:prenyltransferase/squalene oxidase repeat-containing protein [Streptomyces carminius]PJE94370.1 hypothetical protein CUT44_29445 [Streptomyces carminius]